MKLIFVSILFAIIIFILCGCGNGHQPIKNVNTESAMESNIPVNQIKTHQQLLLASRSTRYSLSSQRFNNIRAGNELIRKSAVYYSTYLDPNQNGYVTEIRRIIIQLSYFGEEVSLNTISEYNAWFERIDLSVTPPSEQTGQAVISASDINTYIFDYLIASRDNIDYFFSGEEFNEVGDPYTGSTRHINPNDYAITLYFIKPGNVREEWVISKSTNAEDLANEPILAGLVNIIETEFMSRFED